MVLRTLSWHHIATVTNFFTTELQKTGLAVPRHSGEPPVQSGLVVKVSWHICFAVFLNFYWRKWRNYFQLNYMCPLAKPWCSINNHVLFDAIDLCSCKQQYVASVVTTIGCPSSDEVKNLYNDLLPCHPYPFMLCRLGTGLIYLYLEQVIFTMKVKVKKVTLLFTFLSL